MHPTGLRLLRILALIFMLGCIFVFVAGVVVFQEYAADNPDRFGVYSMEQAEIEQILSPIGLSFAWWVQYNLFGTILIAAVYCTVGGFIFFRRSESPFGLLVAVTLVLYGTLTMYPADALQWAHPELEPVLDPLGACAWPLLFFLFYLFPDGRFTPRWARWPGIALLLLTFTAIRYPSGPPPISIMIITMLLIVVGMGSQVYRYRTAADAIQRQQMKWVLFAIVLLGCLLLLGSLPMIWPGFFEPASPTAAFFLLLIIVTSLSPILLPLAIGIAILRYRLWDIDLIIRKTLVWGAISALLGLVFFGGVTLLQSVFSAVSNRLNFVQAQSPLSIVLSTLAIAALFNPLRKRIQELVDLRFFRRKYDAEQALASFAALAREEVDLEEISDRLLKVVEETVQPEHASLWLRPSTEGLRK